MANTKATRDVECPRVAVAPSLMPGVWSKVRALFIIQQRFALFLIRYIVPFWGPESLIRSSEPPPLSLDLPRVMSANVNTDKDYNTIHDLVRAIANQDLERDREFRTYVLSIAACTGLVSEPRPFRFCDKHRTVEGREQGQLYGVIGVVVEETIAMRRRLCDKLVRKSLKLAGVMSLAIAGDRLDAIKSYALAKGAEIIGVSTTADCHAAHAHTVVLP